MRVNLYSVKKITLAILLGCLSFNSMATDKADNKDELSISLKPSKTNATVIVQFLNISTTTPATVKVLDQSGDTIYEETLAEQESHTKKYNFSKLKPGKYFMVLKSETGEIRKPFIVGMNGSVREDKSEAIKKFKPVIIEKKDIEQVQVMFNNSTGAPLTVKLVDKKGNTLYKEEVQEEQNYLRALNLKDIPSGQYALVINGYEYHYNFYREIRKF